MDLTDALVRKLADGARIERVWPLTGGVSATVHAVTMVRPDGARDQVVLRRLPDPDRLAREHALLVRLHQGGLPVAAPRLFDPASGTLVLELVEGTTDLPPAPAAPLADLLARIHACPLAALPELEPRVDPVPELLAWLPEQPGLAAALRARGVFCSPPVLLHGDYWPGNLLWQDGVVAAVLDWEDAAAGDPLSDLACARVELACAAGEAVAEAFTDHYLGRTGVDRGRLPVWDLYVSTAALRFMGQWGLAPEVLAERRARTAARQAHARQELGLDRLR